MPLPAAATALQGSRSGSSTDLVRSERLVLVAVQQGLRSWRPPELVWLGIAADALSRYDTASECWPAAAWAVVNLVEHTSTRPDLMLPESGDDEEHNSLAQYLDTLIRQLSPAVHQGSSPDLAHRHQEALTRLQVWLMEHVRAWFLSDDASSAMVNRYFAWLAALSARTGMTWTGSA